MTGTEKVMILKELYEVSTDEELANKLGISVFAVRNWKQRNSLPKKYELIIAGSSEKIFDAELLKYNKAKQEGREYKLDIDVLRAQHGQTLLRYFENVTASAGYGSGNDDENFEVLNVGRAFLKSVFGIDTTKRTYDMIKVSGDSMEPFVRDGDIILIDANADIKNGDIVIANLFGDVYVKKFLRDKLHNSVKLTSLNAFYQDIVLKDDEVENLKLIGKVICRFSIDMKVF